MTDLLKQMAEALRHIENAATDPRIQRYEIRAAATEALAKFDAQAAEQAAGGGEAVSNTTTGEINGRHDGIRPAVHGRVVLGGCAPGALADLLFASDDVMSLNAKLGLTMDQLVPLAQAVLSAISIHPTPAAPVQQVGELTAEQRDAQEAPFEAWWDKHGQFQRAGGGAYEKTFAWHAWCAALAARGEKR